MQLCVYAVISPDHVNQYSYTREFTDCKFEKKAQVLGAFASSRGASVSFVTFVRLSSCIRRFSLNAYPWNLILETYMNICW